MINRRRFMQLVGAAFVPIPAIADEVQVSDGNGIYNLMGDGIHDDGPALNALLAGKPVSVGPLVDFTDAGWFGDTLVLPKGKFFTEETLVISTDREKMSLLGGKAEIIMGAHVDGAVRIIPPPDSVLRGVEYFTLSGLTVWRKSSTSHVICIHGGGGGGARPTGITVSPPVEYQWET